MKINMVISPLYLNISPLTMEICIRHMYSIGQKVCLGFRNILWKNLNKLFSQTIVCVCVCLAFVVIQLLSRV